MIKPEDVTIVIPHLGGSKEAEYALDQCWQSLEETAKDIKKVVVINGRKCDLAKHHEIATIMVKDQGQCRAVNVAVANTNTPWIMVTNDDMVYSPDWFFNLVKDPPFDCISPKLIEPRPGAPTFITYFCGGAGGDFDKQKWLEYAANYQAEGEIKKTGFNLPFLI